MQRAIPRTVEVSIVPPTDSVASPTSVTLSATGSGNLYEASYDGFVGDGIWELIYTATDSNNNTALARQAYVTVSGPLNYIAGSVTPLSVPRGSSVKFTVTVYNGWSTDKNLTTATYITFGSDSSYYQAFLKSATTVPATGSAQLAFDYATIPSGMATGSYTLNVVYTDGTSNDPSFKANIPSLSLQELVNFFALFVAVSGYHLRQDTL
jgi:hypothetical protein